ncbi:MAG: apolipoprotein N-acyltransferase [Microlunatus sp.]|nr:apolipoprotein N-acyltransferase [Microlunatus sp.]
MWWSRWARGAVAVTAGILTGLAWQPYGWWPLLLVGLPALTLLIRSVGHHRPRRSAFGLGYLYGLGMLAVTISWVHVLGSWVAVLLIAFEALFFGLLGLTLHLTSMLRWWPLAAALCWSLVEFCYSRVPFGGFGWTRLAYAAVDTPLAGFLPFIGVAGVSFLVAMVAQLVAYLVALLIARRTEFRRTVRPLATVGIGIVLLALLGAVLPLVPLGGSATGGSLKVGIVQGNVPGRGIEALGRMRSVTNNHLSETVNLMVRARLGLAPMPDFLLWPENSTDIDPALDPVTARTVQAAAAIAGRPILVGAVTQGPGPDQRQTAALWWDPVAGVLARYYKQDLVPFGEWIPFRDQLLPLVPILKEVGAQSVPGTAPGVLTVPLDDRTVRIGDIICFELAYDSTVYGTLRGGAEVLMVQSNNATYGGTGQIEQQFAITRARAMETRREIAVATTNSVSGFIDRDGRIAERTQEFTAASLVVDMPLRTGLTPAVWIAGWLDRVLALGAIIACLLGLTAAARRGLGLSAGTAVRQDDGSGRTGAGVAPDRPTTLSTPEVAK